MDLYLVQSELSWEDPSANLSHFTAILEKESLTPGSIVILPEMFSTGFSTASKKLAEPMSGTAVNWMTGLASRLDITLTGSVIIEEDGNYYNRMIWANRDKQNFYDKRHLFRMAGEHKYYSMGNKQVTFEQDGIKICPQICYDLRFPVWSRNTSGYDVLIYVANWPAARAEQWLALLRARAIENQAYVIGVNRIGTDGNNVAYQGDSIAFDYLGNTIAHLKDAAEVRKVTLDIPAMHSFRDSFPAHLDADNFQILDKS